MSGVREFGPIEGTLCGRDYELTFVDDGNPEEVLMRVVATNPDQVFEQRVKRIHAALKLDPPDLADARIDGLLNEWLC